MRLLRAVCVYRMNSNETVITSFLWDNASRGCEKDWSDRPCLRY